LISRLIVEAARLSDAAIERIERPATKDRDISSRSASVSANLDRRLEAGLIPPVSARIPCIDECFRSNSWAIFWSDSPFRHRSHINAF
jgi:hypothetical protein